MFSYIWFEVVQMPSSMMPKLSLNQVVRISFLIVILFIIITSFSWVPPAGMAGAPGEANCFNCHISTSTDSEVLLSKQFGLTYYSNQTYDFNLKIINPGAEFFGFIITEIDASLNTSGQFQHADSTRYAITNLNGRDYLSHYKAEDSLNRRMDSTVFNFTWTAPDTASGPITFYYCARAQNPNDPQSDMLTYCDSMTITPSTNPLEIARINNQNAHATAYPNPGMAMLQISGLKATNTSTIKIIDAMGKVMYESAVNYDVETIQTEQWLKGFYFIHLTGAKSERIKWVKM